MTEYEYKTCPVCGIHYAVDAVVMKYKLKSASKEDRGWNCPNGHSLIFTEYTSDKLQRELDRVRQQIAQKDDEIAQKARELVASKGQITKLKKRASAGTCPCCNRTFSNMSTHMRKQHPEFPSKPDLKVVGGKS